MTKEELVVKWRRLAKTWINHEEDFWVGYALGLGSATADVEIHLIEEVNDTPSNDNNDGNDAA